MPWAREITAAESESRRPGHPARPVLRERPAQLPAVKDETRLLAQGNGSPKLRRSAKSAPALPSLGASKASARGGQGGSFGPGQLLCAEDLGKLPTAEAFRQVLIQHAGSLKQAYHVMGQGKRSTVDFDRFELGLSRLGVLPGALRGYCDNATLFRELDSSGTGCLSLRELLCYVPIKRQDFSDTRTNLAEYANRAAASPSCLARAPRWKLGMPDEGGDHEGPFSLLGSDPDDRERRRRDLRRKIREVGNDLPFDDKRAFVAGLVPPDQYADNRVRERNQAIILEKRIKGAMVGCTRARCELMGLQQAMRLVSEGPQKKVDPPKPVLEELARRRERHMPRVDVDIAECIRASLNQGRRGSIFK